MASVAWGLNSMLRRVQDSKDRWVLWFKDTTVKIIVILLLITLQLWISVFLYGSFYYAYMPTVAHLKPVFLQFTSTCDRFSGTEPCPFPHSNATLVKSPYTNLLMKGQKYKVSLELEMPQSPVNEELGVFMVKMDFLSFKGESTAKSTRPVMIRYRSPILKMLEVFIYSPLLLTGYSEEKQVLTVTLLEDFIDNSYKPVIGAFVELQARKIEVYSSVLKIQAHFVGLRYFMFYWPIMSSVIGIGSFFLLLSIFTMLSWQQCAPSFWKMSDPEVEDIPVRYTRPVTYEERRSIMKRNMEQERLSLFQGRPQYVTVSGASPSDASSTPLRSSQSEPSLLSQIDQSNIATTESVSTGRVETLSQSNEDTASEFTASEFTDTTSAKSPDEETKTSQGDVGSESSDEAHGFEKLEKEEEEENKNEMEVEGSKEDGSTSGEKNKTGLESLSPDTELRQRQVHGQEDLTQ
ncbi:seipin-like [Amphiura filiformis]|uniref:seipin-like n=1 Tax=Amphiura filiformis TaxID=82378 RepID=UPI003B20D11B